MSEELDVSSVRDVLEKKRSDLASELHRLTDVPRDPTATVSFGKRVGDGTTEAVDRLNKTGAAMKIHEALKDVDRALAKVDEGSYGRCDSCEGQISQARLEARPWSTRCIDCS